MDRFKERIDFSLKENGALPLAAFDADGTLWSKDAGHILLKHQIEKSLIPHLPRSYDEFLNRIKKGNPYDQTLSYMACVNEGLSLKQIREWVKESLSLKWISQFAFKPMKEIISFLLERGVQVYIVTASLKWSVEPLAHYFGIPLDHVLGVSNRVKNGILTKELHFPLPWKEGKVKTLLKETNGKRPFLAAGNSINDFPLIDLATHIKVAVSSAEKNTTNFESEQKLKKIGKERNWELFCFTPAHDDGTHDGAEKSTQKVD